jgi:hypothetical protein
MKKIGLMVGILLMMSGLLATAYAEQRTCTKNSDCWINENIICMNGICVSKPCTSDSQCFAGAKCRNGYCDITGITTTTRITTTTIQSCRGQWETCGGFLQPSCCSPGTCKFVAQYGGNYCIWAECTSDDECTFSGKKCISGVCQSVTTTTTRITTTTIGGDKNDRCGGPLNIFENCKAGLVCKYTEGDGRIIVRIPIVSKLPLIGGWFTPTLDVYGRCVEPTINERISQFIGDNFYLIGIGVALLAISPKLRKKVGL